MTIDFGRVYAPLHISYISYGVRIGIAGHQDWLDTAILRLPPGRRAKTASSVDRLYTVCVKEHPLFTLKVDDQVQFEGAIDPLLDLFQADVKLYVAEMARRRTFVHAGTVGWREKAILFPGLSFAGKSTLVLELVRSGCEYYSDEYAVLDARGRVYPYARPIRMRIKGGSRPVERSISSLGGRAGVRPLVVGAVIVCQYKSGGHWRPRRMLESEAVLSMLANTVSARSSPRKAINAIERAVVQSISLKSVRGEAAETACEILKWLEATFPSGGKE